MIGRYSLTLALTLALAPGAAASEELFTKRVAPLLSRACLGCHDAQKKRGGLDLSGRDAALKGGEQGAVIVPGSAAKSRLLQMVSGDKPRMPRSGPKLTSGELAVLKKWIDDGAKWPRGVTLKPTPASEGEVWWSLRPLKRPAILAVKDRDWVRTPVDNFVLAALEARGLRPSAEAERRTLIRRVTFDLTGLPPTPEEIDAFLSDDSPDAYERLVDRLLASPAHGERWGRHWLDVARYGDSHGYDKDKRRDHAWPYRDWVIAAFNSDLPYPQFVRDQIAGDVLRPRDRDAIAAAGFVVAGPWDFVGHVELREGTVDKEKTRLLDRDDMVSSAIGSFMSLTVGCARCHDHKFDPIGQHDYYRLQAVFAGVERGDRLLEDDDATKRRAALVGERDRLKRERDAVLKKLDAVTSPALKKLDAELAKLRADLAALPAAPAAAPSPSNGYHSGIAAKPDVVKWVQVDLGSSLAIDEVRLIPARPTDFRDAPGFGFPLRFRVEASDEATFAKPTVLLDRTKEDVGNPGDNPHRVPVKGVKARHVRVTATRLWKRSEDYVFALAELQVDSGGKNVARGKTVTALDSIEAGRWSRRFLVDDFDSRRRLPDLGDAEKAKDFRRRLELSEGIRDAETKRAALAEKEIPTELKTARADLERRLAVAEKAVERSLSEGPRIYSALPRPARPIWVLQRGDVERKKEAVTPGTLSCVGGLGGELRIDRPEEEGRRRLALAEWIADERNGPTWRSIVNRVWHYHFGRGLVDTPNDFGKMGSLPTHPELLDWLAAEFRGHGSLKKLHRLIVTSAVYRQSSGHDERAAKVDSDNRYLWRQNRRRLDAEGIRDAVLAVSGRLDRRMGGPGYDLFRFKDDHSPTYDHSDLERIHDPATYRRTVYRFTVRSVPNPFLDCLDGADPNQTTPVRNTTVTALQALALLNNPFMVRQATHFAERLKGRSPKLEGQLGHAFRLAYGRPATKEELALVKAHAEEHGLAATCRVLLNANEFVFVD